MQSIVVSISWAHPVRSRAISPSSRAVPTPREAKPSQLPTGYIGAYPPDLQQLVADKDRYLIERFGYEFSEADKWSEYPKTDFFNHLGSVDVDALTERVESIPESLWKSEDEDKPNKLDELNDTRHIMFRYINGVEDVFNYHDCPLWGDWQDVMLPIMEQAAKGLGYKNYCFPRVMLARLPAGSEISHHTAQSRPPFPAQPSL